LRKKVLSARRENHNEIDFEKDAANRAYQTEMLNEERKNIESLLAPGEHLLWFGKPRQGFYFGAGDIFRIFFSLVWSGFVGLGTMFLWTSVEEISIKLVIIALLLFGFYMIVASFFSDAAQRRKTFYAVTNRRAIIVSGLLRRKVNSFDLRTLTDMKLTEENDGSGTIIFDEIKVSGMAGWVNRDVVKRGRTNFIYIPKFDRIQQAQSVYETIRNTQRQLF